MTVYDKPITASVVNKMRKMSSVCSFHQPNCLNFFLLFSSATGVALSAFLTRLSGLSGYEVNFAMVQMFPLTLALYAINPRDNILSIPGKPEARGNANKLYPIINGFVVRGVNTLTMYEALNHVHSGEVLLISTFVSLFGSVCAELIIFHKKPKLLTIISSIFGIIGIAFIARPDFIFGTSAQSSGSKIWGIFLTIVTGSTSFMYYATVKKCDNISAYWHFFSAAVGTAIFSSGLVYFKNGFYFSECDVTARLTGLTAGLLFAMSAMLTLINVGITMPSIVYIYRFWTILLCYVLEVLFLPTKISWMMLTGSAFVIIALVLQMKSMNSSDNR